MRIGRQIRAMKVRVVGADGKQLGIMNRDEALRIAESSELDLVEVVPGADPPVCKIIDYGKFRYDQTKRERESKKAQHQIKLKEVKVKPNIDEHDFQFKLRNARQFLEKGNKVKITCSLRGREMARPELGRQVVERFAESLQDCANIEGPVKRLGRNLSTVLAPSRGKKAE